MKNLIEIKCVVWDLDGTLWDGVLLEGNAVWLRPGIKTIIQTLDQRGILHSSLCILRSSQRQQAALESFGRHPLVDDLLLILIPALDDDLERLGDIDFSRRAGVLGLIVPRQLELGEHLIQ